MSGQNIYCWSKITNEHISNTFWKKNRIPRICANCNNVETYEKFKRCSGCNIVSFCSKKCQKNHWKKVHKQHCIPTSESLTKEGRYAIKSFQFTFKCNYGIYLEDKKNGIQNDCIIFNDNIKYKYWHIVDLDDRYLLVKSDKEHFLNEAKNNGWNIPLDCWKCFFGKNIGIIKISKIL